MSADILETSAGVITIRITGLLKQAELAVAQQAAGRIMRTQGKVRILVLIEDFLGLEKSGDWGDLSFQMEFDSFIEKIAIVGEERWQDVTFLFTGKGIRKVPIEYFQPTDLPKAKAWLAA